MAVYSAFSSHPTAGTEITAQELAEHLEGLLSIKNRHIEGYKLTYNGLDINIRDGKAIVDGRLVGDPSDTTFTQTVSSNSTTHVWLEPDGDIELETSGAPTNSDSIKLYELDAGSNSVNNVTDLRDETVQIKVNVEASSFTATDTGNAKFEGDTVLLSRSEPYVQLNDENTGDTFRFWLRDNDNDSSAELQVTNESGSTVHVEDLSDPIARRISTGDESGRAGGIWVDGKALKVDPDGTDPIELLRDRDRDANNGVVGRGSSGEVTLPGDVTFSGQLVTDLDANSNKVTNLQQATSTGDAVHAGRSLSGGTGINSIGNLTSDRTIGVDESDSLKWSSDQAFGASIIVGGTTLPPSHPVDVRGDIGDNGTVIWNSSAGYIPQGRLQNESVTVAGNGVSLGGSTSVDHGDLSNVSSSEHVDHSSVSITGGNGLTGGGDLTSSRTLDVNPQSIAGRALSEDGGNNFQVNIDNGIRVDGNDRLEVLAGTGLIQVSTGLKAKEFQVNAGTDLTGGGSTNLGTSLTLDFSRSIGGDLNMNENDIHSIHTLSFNNREATNRTRALVWDDSVGLMVSNVNQNHRVLAYADTLSGSGGISISGGTGTEDGTITVDAAQFGVTAGSGLAGGGSTSLGNNVAVSVNTANGIRVNSDNLEVTAGTDLSQNSAGLAHASTGSDSENVGGANVIDQVSTDNRGHVETVGSRNLNSEFIGEGQSAGGDLSGSYPSPGVSDGVVNPYEQAKKTSGKSVSYRAYDKDSIWNPFRTSSEAFDFYNSLEFNLNDNLSSGRLEVPNNTVVEMRFRGSVATENQAGLLINFAEGSSNSNNSVTVDSSGNIVLEYVDDSDGSDGNTTTIVPSSNWSAGDIFDWYARVEKISVSDNVSNKVKAKVTIEANNHSATQSNIRMRSDQNVLDSIYNDENISNNHIIPAGPPPIVKLTIP
jgi:hypothetical protein